MLYDPKWEKQTETKADPFSLAAMIEWLEKQPRDKAYDWYDIRGCIACQYLQSLGHKRPWNVAYDLHTDGYGGPFGSNEAYWNIGQPMPWTMGAALERAREIAARS